MKKSSLLFVAFIALLFNACTECEQPDLAMELNDAKAVLEQYAVANMEEDISLIEKIWAPDDDIVLIGTDSDEVMKGWQEIRKAYENQYTETEEMYINVHDQVVKINGSANAAWFNQFMNYNYIHNGEAKAFEGIRLTGAMEKRNGVWKIVQAHVSIPVAVDVEDM